MNPFPSGVGFWSNFSAVMVFSGDICCSQGALGEETVVVTEVTVVVVSTGAAVVVPTVVVDSVVVSGTGASVTVVVAAVDVVVVVTVVVVSSADMQATTETTFALGGCCFSLGSGVVGTYVTNSAAVSTGVVTGTTTVSDPLGTD